MGPMTAAVRFLQMLRDSGESGLAASLRVTLYGSLAFTGKGHAKNRAVAIGHRKINRRLMKVCEHGRLNRLLDQGARVLIRNRRSRIATYFCAVTLDNPRAAPKLE